jgi:hypothetical protein
MGLKCSGYRLYSGVTDWSHDVTDSHYGSSGFCVMITFVFSAHSRSLPKKRSPALNLFFKKLIRTVLLFFTMNCPACSAMSTLHNVVLLSSDLWVFFRCSCDRAHRWFARVFVSFVLLLARLQSATFCGRPSWGGRRVHFRPCAHSHRGWLVPVSAVLSSCVFGRMRRRARA